MVDKTALVLGTATPGGGFPAYGWPYAEVLNEMDPTLGIQPINTKGSAENVPLLEQDKLDLGLVTGEVTYEAINGISQPKAVNLRIISATYSQAGMFMVRADSPYRAIADLKGKPIVWGAATSGFIVLARAAHHGEARVSQVHAHAGRELPGAVRAYPRGRIVAFRAGARDACG